MSSKDPSAPEELYELTEPKKRRNRGPTSRTGCGTCKSVLPRTYDAKLTIARQRRIKCDEQTPVCLNCFNSHRQCESNAAIQPNTSGSPVQQNPVKIIYWRPPNALNLQQLSVDIAGNAEERRAFSLYRSNLASTLDGWFVSGFWSKLVLQACHTDPAVRHAVIALAALHEIERSPKPAQQSTTTAGKSPEQFALVQCNKAITELNQHLSKNNEDSLEILLISCVIFTCFESLRGNINSSLRHMWSGVKLFRNWQRRHQTPQQAEIGRAPSPRPGVEAEITQMFARLNLHSMLFISTDKTPESVEEVWASQAIAPAISFHKMQFSGLAQARDTLDDCLSYAMHSTLATFLRRQRFPQNPKAQMKSGPDLEKLLQEWSTVFRDFKKAFGPNLKLEEREAIMFLEMQYMSGKILLEAGLVPDETVFDQYLSVFDEILSRASFIISNQRGPDASDTRKKFAFDLGIVAHLYFVSTRCREPSIRRRALTLLSKASRQECVWDSQLALQLAGKIMTIEEENAGGPVTSCKDVPHSCRLSLSNCFIDSERRCIQVDFVQGRNPVGSDEPPNLRHEEVPY